MNKRSLRAEKEFGLVVGGVLVLLSLWWFYRGKFSSLTTITLPLGLVLVLFGTVYPRALVWPNWAWMKLSEGLSFITTRIILAFVFFAVMTPIGIVKRALGWDPLRRRSGSSDSYWQPYSQRQQDPKHYEKMY